MSIVCSLLPIIGLVLVIKVGKSHDFYILKYVAVYFRKYRWFVFIQNCYFCKIIGGDLDEFYERLKSFYMKHIEIVIILYCKFVMYNNLSSTYEN